MKTEVLIRHLSENVLPVRSLKPPIVRYIFWLLFAAPFVYFVTFWIGLRADAIDLIFEPIFLLQVFVLIILSGATGLSAFYLAIPDSRKRQFFLKPGAISVVWLLVFSGMILIQSDYQVGIGWKCLRNILVLSLPPAGLFYYLLSKALPLDRGITYFFGLMGAASLGCLATRFICLNNDPLHFFIWHCVPVIAVGGVGLIIGRFLCQKF